MLTSRPCVGAPRTDRSNSHFTRRGFLASASTGVAALAAGTSIPGEHPTLRATALKFLQIMTEKGLVRRDESQRTHIYRASLPKEETQRHLVSDLLERAFEGSAARLAAHALSTHKASPEELKEIRRLLDEFEVGQDERS